MELLYSKIPPIKHRNSDFFTTFSRFAKDSDRLVITTGFISVQSILFFTENLRAANLPPTDLLVGMHAFDGITKPQFEAALKLVKVLVSKGGDGHIATSFPFHGKLYTFHKRNAPTVGILGSSNFSALDPDRGRIFEVDLVFDDPTLLANAVGIQKQLIERASKRILDWKPTSFRSPENVGIDIPGVDRISRSEVDQYRQEKEAISFEIPLKTEEKSSLNVYFGKGRENTKTGFIRPRPWYEAELIVPAKISRKPGYPRNQKFVVVTDDGWCFECKTQGSNAKNFRSTESLAKFGSWIKGRLEASGALQIGKRVTDATLKKYGRSTITLTKTRKGNVWFLDFST